MNTFFTMLATFALLATSCYADKVVWKGEISSDGTPSKLITLTLHKEYQIKVSGSVKLGKWVKEGEPLANDACYEFSKEKMVDKFESVMNSNLISCCDGTYHPDHHYQSQPFKAKQDRIHFWVNDTVYDDNHGSFNVEIIQLDK